jgi:predicted RNA polymerase sigma factor
MSNRASDLAAQAWYFAERERYDEAVAAFGAAVAAAQPDMHDVWQLHGEFASVLVRAGRLREAEAQSRLSLDAALRQEGREDSSPVVLTRYFLAEMIVATRPQEALEVITPSLAAPPKLQRLARAMQAEALSRLGRPGEARAAAEQAVALCQTDQQQATMRQRLAHLLEEAAGQP